MDYPQFLRDASRATAGMGIDTEPVCYMGDHVYAQLLASVTPDCPVNMHAQDKRVGGVQVYIVREDRDHYHMTFRRQRT
jgi:hypothetical protein